MPFQRLFARRDQRTFHAAAKEDLMDRAAAFLREAQFRVQAVSPAQLHAEQHFQKLGLRRVADLWFQQHDGDATVTLDFSATLGDEEAVVGIIGAALVLPLAVAVGAVSYLDYQRDADYFTHSFWNYLGSAAGTSPGTRCGNCGLEVDRDARFCKRCGAQIKV